MPNSIPRICIHCVEANAEYTLQFAGSQWSESYGTIEEAILKAGQVVVEETELLIYDCTGEGLVKTALFPRPQGGAKACHTICGREHSWRHGY